MSEGEILRERTQEEITRDFPKLCEGCEALRAPPVSFETSWFLREIELCLRFGGWPIPGGISQQPISWLLRAFLVIRLKENDGRKQS